METFFIDSHHRRLVHATILRPRRRFRFHWNLVPGYPVALMDLPLVAGHCTRFLSMNLGNSSFLPLASASVLLPTTWE